MDRPAAINYYQMAGLKIPQFVVSASGDGKGPRPCAPLEREKKSLISRSNVRIVDRVAFDLGNFSFFAFSGSKR